MSKNLINKTSLIALALGANFAIIQADSYNSYNQPRETAYGENQTTTTSNQELEKKIRSKIESGWFSKGYEQLNVRVNNGNVTIQGPVKTWKDKEGVEKEVRNIPGVISLNSQITVTEPNSNDSREKEFAQDKGATSEDNQLNKKIRDQVSRGWLWDSYKQVILNTSNGNVTLEGFVRSNSNQQKLIDEIKKVDGVKSVKSELRIRD